MLGSFVGSTIRSSRTYRQKETQRVCHHRKEDNAQGLPHLKRKAVAISVLSFTYLYISEKYLKYLYNVCFQLNT